MSAGNNMLADISLYLDLAKDMSANPGKEGRHPLPSAKILLKD